MGTTVDKIFTFHNVSINSGGMPKGRTIEILFTFHNVSINSRWR